MNLFINILGAIALFIAGLLCLPDSSTSESTMLKRFLEVATPHKGWFGIMLSIWGLWEVMGAVFGLRALGLDPIGWLTSAVTSAMCLGAGFLLGYEMIQKRFLLNASDQTKEKVETVHKWLAEKQSSVSLLALGVAGWLIIYSVIFSGRIHF